MSTEKAKRFLVGLDPDVLIMLDRVKGGIHRGSRSMLINAILKGTLLKVERNMNELRVIPLDGCKVKL